jgi:hypothetical protein
LRSPISKRCYCTIWEGKGERNGTHQFCVVGDFKFFEDWGDLPGVGARGWGILKHRSVHRVRKFAMAVESDGFSTHFN